MEEKIDNPVSRKIVTSVWNRLSDYFPEIRCYRGGAGSAYSITARLPEEIHKKWIVHINSSPEFREKIRREIEEIFSSYVFNGQSFLEIRWDRGGTSFETDGVNGCLVYVSSDTGTYSYTCHNIDSYEQASVLFIALSVFLPQLYFALETFESGRVDLSKFPPLQKEIFQKITLHQVPECQMTSDQCIHKYTFICGVCTRNPKAFFLKRNEDLARIGDKWEPKGGLPGKELCPVCGANISTGKCPVCERKTI